MSYPCPAGYRAGEVPSTHLLNKLKVSVPVLRWLWMLWDTQGTGHINWPTNQSLSSLYQRQTGRLQPPNSQSTRSEPPLYPTTTQAVAGMNHQLLLLKQLNQLPCMWILAARSSLICLRINDPLACKAQRFSLAPGASTCPALSLPGAGCLGLRKAAESLGIESHYINNTIGSRAVIVKAPEVLALKSASAKAAKWETQTKQTEAPTLSALNEQ